MAQENPELIANPLRARLVEHHAVLRDAEQRHLRRLLAAARKIVAKRSLPARFTRAYGHETVGLIRGNPLWPDADPA